MVFVVSSLRGSKRFTRFIDFVSAASRRKNGELCEFSESYAGQLQANYSNWPPQAKIISKIHKIYSLHYIKFSGAHHPCGGRERSEQENRTGHRPTPPPKRAAEVLIIHK